MMNGQKADNNEGSAHKGGLMKNTAVIALIVLLGAASSFAFDNNRKGLVFGAGIAFTPYSKVQETKSNDYAKGIGEGAHGLLGYGIDARDLIVAEINGSFCKSTSIHAYPYYIKRENDYQATQAFYGIAWYRYYGRVDKSFFTTVGVGYYYFNLHDYDRTEKGNALLLGLGYEFGHHIQCGAYLALGKSTYRNWKLSHRQLNLMISSIAF